jgi:hypothetical protein
MPVLAKLNADTQMPLPAGHVTKEFCEGEGVGWEKTEIMRPVHRTTELSRTVKIILSYDNGGRERKTCSSFKPSTT